MKRLFTCIIILLVMAIGFMPVVFAEGDSGGKALVFKGEISAKNRTVSVKILLGSANIPEEEVLAGFEAVLEYPSDVLNYNEITASDGWDVTGFDQNTKRFTIETKNKIKLNKNGEIAEIKFNIKDGIETLDSDITIKNIEWSIDGNDITITPNSQAVNVKLTKTEPAPEEKKDEEQNQGSQEENGGAKEQGKTGENGQGQAKQEKTKQPDEQKTSTPADEKAKAKDITSKAEEAVKKDGETIKNSGDLTAASKVLPKTGRYKAMAIIGIIALISVILGIRYKSIKLK